MNLTDDGDGDEFFNDVVLETLCCDNNCGPRGSMEFDIDWEERDDGSFFLDVRCTSVNFQLAGCEPLTTCLGLERASGLRADYTTRCDLQADGEELECDNDDGSVTNWSRF